MSDIKPKTIEIFCAKCQEDTPHTGTVDLNGELVLTCQDCEGFIKLPAGMTLEEKQAYLSDHKESNSGQVNIAGSYKELEELMSSQSVA